MKNLFNRKGLGDEFKETERESIEKPSFALKIVDHLAPMYRIFGVNYEQVHFIVDTKLKMDKRQENPIDNVWNSGKNAQKKEKNSFFSTLWIYALISCFMLLMFLYDNYVFQFTVYFSYLFVMMLAILIAQFSTILLDPKDQEQIGTKPIYGKTLGAAKATHIGIYLIAFSLALGGPMLIATFIVNGVLSGILTFFLTLLAAIWCLFLTILVYAFVLRHFDGEKLKNIISYSQIGISVFMIMGYYFMTDLFEIINPETLALEMNMQWWHILVFPIWFVAPYSVIEEGFSGTFGIYLGLLVLGTVGLILLYRTYSDKIDRNLQKMNSDGAKGSQPSRLSQLYAKLFCKEKERPYFDFAWQLTKNEREFKTRLYPSIASSLVFPIIMLWTTFTSGEMEIINGPSFLAFLPYFVMMVIPMLSTTIRYSNNHNAGWLFQMSPEQSDTAIFKGVFKAMYLKLLVPIYAAVSVVVLIFTGWPAVLTLINGLLLISLVFFVELNLSLKSIPFTQKYSASEANRGCIGTLIFLICAMITVGLFILIHLLVPFAEYILLVVLLGGNVWIFTHEFKKKHFQPFGN